MASFGDKLKSFRKMRNLTQAELASKIGITQQSINRWENGNFFPKSQNIAHLASALGIPAAAFIDGDTDTDLKAEINKAQEIQNKYLKIENGQFVSFGIPDDSDFDFATTALSENILNVELNYIEKQISHLSQSGLDRLGNFIDHCLLVDQDSVTEEYWKSKHPESNNDD